MKLLFVILLLCFSYICTAETIVKTVGKQKPDDASHAYFIGLLKLALEKTAAEYGAATIETIPHPGQARVIRLLATGNFYDIAWSGNSIKRNNLLLSIPFPLFKGGLGWRGFVIRKTDQRPFAQVKNINDLSNYIACQGLHWPDADILEDNGLNVYRVSHFDAMLQMIVLKRCDYLPLSIFEGDAELAIVSKSFPELVFQKQVILKYPLTMNFFVRKDNSELANRVTAGLLKLHQSGEFIRYMRNNPLTKNAFPLTQFLPSTVIKLENPNLIGTELNQYGLKWPTNQPH